MIIIFVINGCTMHRNWWTVTSQTQDPTQVQRLLIECTKWHREDSPSIWTQMPSLLIFHNGCFLPILRDLLSSVSSHSPPGAPAVGQYLLKTLQRDGRWKSCSWFKHNLSRNLFVYLQTCKIGLKGPLMIKEMVISNAKNCITFWFKIFEVCIFSETKRVFFLRHFLPSAQFQILLWEKSITQAFAKSFTFHRRSLGANSYFFSLYQLFEKCI